MKSKPLCILFIYFLMPGFLRAQGILPPKPKTKQESKSPTDYLLVGETVPKTLTLKNAEGEVFPLLSYKTATDVLVVGFYSPVCATQQTQWHNLKLLYDRYKDWHVTYLGVSVNSEDNLGELATAMSNAGLPYPVVRDEHQNVAHALHVTATPEILVIDEWGQLRYRGPVASASKAVEAVVGHVEPVANPEPSDLGGCPIQ